MLRKGITQVVALALAAVLLASAPAMAGGLPGRAPAAGSERQDDGSLWSRAWLWLQSLWEDPAGAVVCGGDAGGCIDPNGAAACKDEGACIDPNG
ncbi:MAG TPA: hypothetical protein VEW48_15325 [Thermoanaerobaculia bacterium]|nr:hypothetical protein [Thermoanaerobaculia bacterium]